MDKQDRFAQDAVKGFMVIAVIFFHCLLTTFTVHIEVLSKFSVLTAIFPFLISSFFFYSGYNYSDSGRTYRQNIARRAKQLLIPLVIAAVASVIIIGSIELIYRHNDVAGTLKNIGNSLLYSLMSEPAAIMSGFAASHEVVFELILSLGLLWFLYSLFICSLVFYALVKYTNKSLPALISIVVALLLCSFALGQFVGVYLPYTCQCYPLIIAIMLTAAHLKQHNFLDREIKTKKTLVFTCINVLVAEGLVVGTSLLCYYLFGATYTGSLPGGMFDAHLKGFDAFVAFGFSIVGTYFIHTVCRLLRYIPVFRTCIQWVGQRSAFYYLFQAIFIEVVAVMFNKKTIWGQAQAFFYLFVVIALLTLAALLVDLILKKRRKNREIPQEK